jgi:sterol desaturase/sphingolipid hydroxylase (fatty acid hydroxylase superfamily)
MNEFLQNKALILAVCAAILFALERQFPSARPLLKAHLESGALRAARALKNLSLLLINAGLSPLLVIPVSALAAQWSPDWRPAIWSGAAGLVADLLILDLWIYWWHRTNHLVPLFWRFHQVHHLDEFLDVTTAVRFHFGEVVFSAFVRAAVIFVLAIPLSSVIVFETLVLMAALFHHSNLRLPPAFERALSFVIVTPSLHWVHHHAIRRDTDSNYSTILSVWDRIFASRSRTARTPDMPIGVETLSDEPLIGLLARPFRRFGG